MARVQRGLRHIANSSPPCQGEQLVIGEREQTPTPPPTNKHTNPCTFPLCKHETLQSLPSRLLQLLSHTRLGSILCLCSSAFFFSPSHDSKPISEGECWRRVSACEGLHWGVYPPGPEPLGPIRGCKYFMRYDSTAQTLLNHRPLTIFSGYVPFGKARNNEINKHSLPPVTARALRGEYAARLLMRGSVLFPLLQERKNHWPIQQD